MVQIDIIWISPSECQENVNSVYIFVEEIIRDQVSLFILTSVMDSVGLAYWGDLEAVAYGSWSLSLALFCGVGYMPADVLALANVVLYTLWYR